MSLNCTILVHYLSPTWGFLILKHQVSSISGVKTTHNNEYKILTHEKLKISRRLDISILNTSIITGVQESPERGRYT